MENRRPVHYSGNSLAPPQPGKKRLYRQRQTVRRQGTIITNDKIPKWDPKVTATLECVWCGAQQSHYSIRCRSCGNCQYCGLLIDNPHGCRFCGNHLDDNLERFYGEVKLRRQYGPSEPTSSPNRTVRRVGPETRDRRSGIAI